jgi:hypothetical protein
VITGRKVNKAFILNGQKPVVFDQQGGKINLSLKPAPMNYVIVLEMDGDVMNTPVL